MSLIDSAAAILTRIVFRFEFLFPQLVRFFVRQKLKEYKLKGVIEDYTVKAERRRKGHYRFILELSLKLAIGGENCE